MILFIVLFALFGISIVWSFWSLKKMLDTKKETDHVKQELLKGRVVFQNDSSSSSSGV